MPDPPLVEVSLVVRHADRLVVGVSGEIDHGSAGPFLDAVGALRADGDRHLVLDLSGCAFCDSAGISALVKLMRQTQHQDGQMLLVGSRPIIARTLDITGLSRLIPNYQAVPDALAALPAPPA